MKVSIAISFVINIFIVYFELLTLSKVKRKREIFKYYTYLQNFLTLIVSMVFCVFSFAYLVFNKDIPEFVRGLRYIVTCGLVATTLIYVVLLSSNKNNKITENDFNSSISPKKANLILHYICPLLSVISFVGFERSIVLETGIWTLLVAIPSIIYWIIYAILSTLKLWKEPYDLSFGKNNKVLNIIIIALIPISFILITFILWNIK